ncbi:MAG: hypothetical protein JNL71_13940 [Rhodospirillales bacterium]|nr:hypothetical protein [Rhodospirillales bacterium]
MKAFAAATLACLGAALSACSSDAPPVRGPSAQTLRAIERVSDQDFAVPVEGGLTALLPVFADKKLVDPHAGVKRAVIGIQDATRNAGAVFDALRSVVGEGPDSMVMVPQFLAAQDTEKHGLGPDFARWTIEGWRDGGNSRPATLRDSSPLVSSFAVLDALLLYLSDRAVFPDLAEIAFVGYGQSARTVQLYAATGKGLEEPARAGVKLRFVVAGADTFLYFDDKRPGRGEDGFATFEREQCVGFNQWPYGAALPAVYAFGRTGRDLAAAYVGREVVYLVGDRDTDPADRGCEARAQGRNRLDRAEHYLKHLALVAGAAPAGQRVVVAKGAPATIGGLLGSACGKAALAGQGC